MVGVPVRPAGAASFCIGCCAGVRGCPQRSHSLSLDVLVAGRVDLARVIGWALEQKADGVGHRRIGEGLGVPAATVRGRFRAHRNGMAVASRLWVLAVSADPAVRAPPAESTSPVATLVAAAILAAGALSRLSGEPQERWSVAVAGTGGGLLG